MAKKPKMEMRSGSVRLTAWENERTQDGKTYPVLSFTVERRYRNQKGDWHSSPRLFRRDLLDLSLLCRAAYEKISLKKRDLDEPTTGAES